MLPLRRLQCLGSLGESHLWRKELREVGMNLKRTFTKAQQAEGTTSEKAGGSMVRVERMEEPSKCLFTGLRLVPVLEWPQRRVTSRVPICRPVAVLTQSRPHILLVHVCADVCVCFFKGITDHQTGYFPIMGTTALWWPVSQKLKLGKELSLMRPFRTGLISSKPYRIGIIMPNEAQRKWLFEVTQLDMVERVVTRVR